MVKGIFDNLCHSLGRQIISISLPGEFFILEFYRKIIMESLSYFIGFRSPEKNEAFPKIIFIYCRVCFDYLLT